jgi:hypothetical protein
MIIVTCVTHMKRVSHKWHNASKMQKYEKNITITELNRCDTVWHCDIFVKPNVFQFIRQSNDSRRHGRGTHLFTLETHYRLKVGITASFLVFCCYNYVNTNFSAQLAVMQALKSRIYVIMAKKLWFGPWNWTIWCVSLVKFAFLLLVKFVD